MKKKLSKKQWWAIGVVSLAAVLALGLILYFANRPQSIGSNLEYVGEINIGCSWEMSILTLGFCDDKQSNHSYLFATNMSEEEVRYYFRHADKVEQLSGLSPDATLVLQKNGKTILTKYYQDAQGFLSANAPSLKTQKMHLFEVSKTDYSVVKSSY